MLSPTQPLKQDDTAGNLPSSFEVVAYCHMGNKKLAIQRKESREGIIVSYFIAEMEHYAIPSSVRVPIGTSLMYRLELPPGTAVFVALCTMQKMSYAFKTCQAHKLPDAFPPGSVGSTHLVRHRPCPPQLVAQDDVDAREVAEYILTLIEDVLEYQRKQTEKLRNQMIDKAVPVSYTHLTLPTNREV